MNKKYTNTKVRNPKIAANINIMHDKWLSEQFPSRVNKPQDMAGSISTVKSSLHVNRGEARRILRNKSLDEITAESQRLGLYD